MSTITVTQLYEQLTSHIGEETAENLCTYVNSKISEELEDRTKILATKDDISVLKADINDLKLAAKEDISVLKADINDLKLATKEDISVLKADINDLRLATKKDINVLKADINDLRLATKEDINVLKADINDLKLATMAEINDLRLETKAEFTKVTAEIVKIHIKFIESKADTMRWMFIFWVGQVAAIFGLLMLFVKK